MPSKIWAQVKNILISEVGRQFERVSLPFLRIEWPDLAYPSDLGFLDCKGIDQAVVTPGFKFPVVIQFKGFEITGSLGKSQLEQVRNSVDSFLASNLCCERYILFYNREGYDQDFEKDAQSIVDELTVKGKASLAEVWNISDAVKFLQSSLDNIVKKKMISVSAKKAKDQQSHFLFGNVLLNDVPYQEATWSFSKNAKTTLSEFCVTPSVQLRKRLTTIVPDTRWTMLIGAFGMGKSTIAVSLGNEVGKAIVYIPANEILHFNNGGGSETNLWRDVARYLDVLGDVMGVEKITPDFLDNLVADSISRMMRGGKENMILVIDGLDENRHFSHINGLKLLINELANTTTPIVMITRREHFFNSYGNYENEFSKLAWQASTKSVRVVELTDWNTSMAIDFLEQAGRLGDKTHSERILVLRMKIQDGSLKMVATHPLWLTMATELAVDGTAINYENLYELYENWTLLKLRRDFDKSRAIPLGFEDNLGILLGLQQAFMQKVAMAMTQVVDDDLVLIESIDEGKVQEIAIGIYGVRVQPEVYSVTSLLEPTGYRSIFNATGINLKFFHASLHEFYVAREIKLNLDNKLRLPEAVKKFLQ